MLGFLLVLLIADEVGNQSLRTLVLRVLAGEMHHVRTTARAS